MLTHVVMLKLKDEHKDKAKTLQTKLMTLPAKISEIKHYEVGINIIESDRSYDICLISKFENQADLETYTVHSDHQAVVTFIKSVAQSVIAVDYESPA